MQLNGAEYNLELEYNLEGVDENVDASFVSLVESLDQNPQNDSAGSSLDRNLEAMRRNLVSDSSLESRSEEENLVMAQSVAENVVENVLAAQPPGPPRLRRPYSNVPLPPSGSSSESFHGWSSNQENARSDKSSDH